MVRPETLMTRGDTLAAQSALALGLLTDKDVFYAFLEYSVTELDKTLVELQDLLTDETSAQAGTTSTTKIVIDMDDGESFDSLRNVVANRMTKRVYRKGRDTRIQKLLYKVQTWYQLFAPGLVASMIKRRHLDPVVDRARTRGGPELATQLASALDALDGLSFNVPFYTGTLLPARTTVPPIVTGRTGPFVIEPGDQDVELDGVTPGTWTLPASTPPVIYGYAQNTTFSAGEMPTLTFDAGAAVPFKTITVGPIVVTMDTTSIATSPGSFVTAVRGQYLKVGAVYYMITFVVSANIVWIDGVPGAGIYPACEVHNPYTFPIVLSSPAMGIDAVEYEIDLGAFATFTQADLQAAFVAAVPGGLLGYTIDAQYVTIEVQDEDDKAMIQLKGTVGGEYPLLYDSLGVVAGAQANGVTDTTSVQLDYRKADGTIAAISTNITGLFMTPADIVVDLIPKLAAGCAVSLVAGKVVFTGLVVGTHAFLQLTAKNLNGVRTWGTSSSVSAPPSGFKLSIPENEQRVGPFTAPLNGTAVVVFNEDLTGQVDATWKFGVQLQGMKHVAYYDISTVVFGSGTTTVTLSMPPYSAVPSASARFIKRPVSIIATDTTPDSFVGVDSSTSAFALGMAGQTDEGETTDFVVPAGTKAGYYVRALGEEFRVVTVHADGSASLETNNPLPASESPVAAIWSPGAESMGMYRALDNTAPPNEIGMSKESVKTALDYVTETRAAINDIDRHKVLVNPEFDAVVEFCAVRKLELLSSMLLYGSPKGFFSSERGTLRSTLSEGSTSYTEHSIL